MAVSPMQSPLTVGILMIAMAGIGLVPLGQAAHVPLGVPQLVIAGLLAAAGVLMILRRPIAFFAALMAAAVLAGTGVAAYLGAPRYALPVHPMISVVIGLYLMLRAAMARGGLRRKPPGDQAGA